MVDLVALKVLDSSGLAEDDRILALEMRRVRDERERDLLARGRRSDVVGSEVVLDVSSGRVVGIGRSLAVEAESKGCFFFGGGGGEVMYKK